MPDFLTDALLAERLNDRATKVWLRNALVDSVFIDELAHEASDLPDFWRRLFAHLGYESSAGAWALVAATANLANLMPPKEERELQMIAKLQALGYKPQPFASGMFDETDRF